MSFFPVHTFGSQRRAETGQKTENRGFFTRSGADQSLLPDGDSDDASQEPGCGEHRWGASNPHMTQFTGERTEEKDTQHGWVALSPHSQVCYREYSHVVGTENTCMLTCVLPNTHAEALTRAPLSLY